MHHQEIVTELAIAIVMAVMDVTAIVIVIVILVVVMMLVVIVNNLRTIKDDTVSFTNPHYRQM